jgi:glycosyltransferase involved in cell wall biosynthesis
MTTGVAPAISVVIPALDRAELLAGTLESLDGQTSAPDHEVIVVDNGSTDATPEVCLPRARAGSLRYRRLARVGNALAKNAGLLAARAALVLFLEDDLAAPDLLAQHVRSHRAHPETAVAVQGLPRTSSAPEPPAVDHVEATPGGLRAGQWSCKRQFLLDHGVFDEAVDPTSVDVELAGRLTLHGFRIVVNPRAISYLAPHG